MVKLFFLLLPLWACNTVLQEGSNYKTEILKGNEASSRQSVDCCLDSILKEVDASMLITPVFANIVVKEGELKIVDANKENTYSQSEVKNWLKENAIQDSIKAFRLSLDINEYYLFSSPLQKATGMAVNFTSWLIVDTNRNLVIEFESLSESHKAFYYEKASGELRFISFVFGESFIHQKDFENIVYKQEIYSITKEGKILIQEKESTCYCN